MRCRHCRTPLHPTDDLFVDLGAAPPSNAFLRASDLDRPERHFPLRVHACPECWLVQVDAVQRHDAMFDANYVYFSGYSSSWLEHARRFVDEATGRLGLDAGSRVVEVASNDGYLLQYVRDRGIPCVGIEPTAGTAAAARARGIETVEAFLGAATARGFVDARGTSDLVVGNNVLAHVPDIDDFVAGLRTLLAPRGCISVEFPHLLQLVRHNQFDTIYHEHFSYLSLHTVQRIFAAHDLEIFDVQPLPTHGGSLRVWAQRSGGGRGGAPGLAAALAAERDAGMLAPAFYRDMQARAERLKDDLLRFLLDAKRDGRRVAGYGAAAKGNTLLNFAGVRPDLLPFVVDASPHKQGRFLPGSRIPVVAEARLREARPHDVLVLPWNLRDEITTQLAYVRDWGGRFVTAVPALAVDGGAAPERLAAAHESAGITPLIPLLAATPAV